MSLFVEVFSWQGLNLVNLLFEAVVGWSEESSLKLFSTFVVIDLDHHCERKL